MAGALFSRCWSRSKLLPVTPSFKGSGLWLAMVVVTQSVLSIGCGSSSSSALTKPNGDGSDDAPPITGGKSDAGFSQVTPTACSGGSPVNGSACDSPGTACLPTGFTCCFCEQAFNCSSPYAWACENSNPVCPASAPSIGSPCTVADTVSCVYCGSPVANLACNGGVWTSVDSLYCSKTL